MSQLASPPYSCDQCSSLIEPGAKFCGGCGTMAHLRPGQFDFAGRIAQPPPTTPSFAPVSPTHLHSIDPQFKREIGKLVVLLVRERVFLYLHCILFVFLNCIGLWLSRKSYMEYIGDDFSKMVVASTPLLFINSLTLLLLLPIKGTMKEITRLKERLNHVRFQIEYNHLL